MLQIFNTSSNLESSHAQHQPSPHSNNASLNLPSNWANISLTSSIKIEKKHFEKINKLADKLLKLCQSERLNLINSPPYIIDILPDLCQAFNTILFAYENELHILNELDYFCLLVKNCTEKLQQAIDLFKVAGKRMYEETSDERKTLTKNTLTFSHILAEMRSLFPRNVYEGQKFRIAKKDAAEFWKNNFGDRILVSWRDFEVKLNKVHQITDDNELKSLKETIQLTKTNFVSIFEFDIFTR
jgi:E3 ubiquitin-protein ligase CBL